jgi:hypothetical protein
MKICKLSSSEVIHLPDKIQAKIPVTIYTSKNCNLCKNDITYQLKLLEPLKDLVMPRVVNIENKDKIPSDVMSLPSLQIGSKVLGSRPTDSDVVSYLRNLIPLHEVK